MCQIIKTTTAEYPQVILVALQTQRRATVKVMGNVGLSLLGQSRELWVTIDGTDIRVGDPTITTRVFMSLGKYVKQVSGLTWMAHEKEKRALYLVPHDEVLGRIHVKQPSDRNTQRHVQCANVIQCRKGIDRHIEPYAMQAIYAEAGKAAQQVGTLFVHLGCLPYLLRLPSCKDEHNEWPDEVRMQLQQKDVEAEQDMTDIYG